MFRFLITLGSLFGFVTGGLDLLERFGVPVDQWLRALPDFAMNVFNWFGFQVDRISVAVFGPPDPVVTTRSLSSEDNGMDGAASSQMEAVGASAETLVISGIFTFMMLVILLLAARGSER
ncbi:hypothetical protein [Hyphobacterium sp.]|uniref:hypothetical protein n=1 Tax=Hyphobacterium sp. TaxID=2004662 RepID=UPI003BA9CD19